MIENLKDLKHLLKLCRQSGVTEITLKDVSFKLGELPKTIPGDTEELDDSDSGFMGMLEAPLAPEELVQFANGAES